MKLFKNLLLLSVAFSLLSCDKEELPSSDFTVNLTITNMQDPENWCEEECENNTISFSAEIRNYGYEGAEGSYKTLAQMGDHKLEFGESVTVTRTYTQYEGQVAQLFVEVDGYDFFLEQDTSGWLADGDQLYWEVGSFDSEIKGNTGENPYTEGGGDSGGGLVGTWVNLSGCQNASGDQTYFQFNSNGSGTIFNVDCNSTCDGGGYFLNYNWEDNGSSVTLNYTSVSEYCGAQVDPPAPETLSYSINGNELSIGGAVFTK